VPSEATQYPHYDWLIGNHCDELTPWIPLIAARFVVTMGTSLLTVFVNMFCFFPLRSSYNTRFFLIPCCFHDFDGKV